MNVPATLTSDVSPSAINDLFDIVEKMVCMR